MSVTNVEIVKASNGFVVKSSNCWDPSKGESVYVALSLEEAIQFLREVF
jgi:hypothetical protein